MVKKKHIFARNKYIHQISPLPGARKDTLPGARKDVCLSKNHDASFLVKHMTGKTLILMALINGGVCISLFLHLPSWKLLKNTL